MLNITDITKKEAIKLNKEYGVPYGEDGISHTCSRRHYFLCESKRNLNALDKIRVYKHK